MFVRACVCSPVVSAPATPTPQAPPISASAVVEALSRSIAALSDRQHALIRRFAASFDTLAEDAALLLAGVSAAGWETVSCCSARQLALYAEKAWEGAAEEVRVRAAQLEASAQVLE
ncbi:MAG: hypothetical protein P4L40_24855, partial [Terracidiphilus sp.]|nr:hypothetical protein [Terracidiphilus sp.]